MWQTSLSERSGPKILLVGVCLLCELPPTRHGSSRCFYRVDDQRSFQFVAQFGVWVREVFPLTFPCLLLCYCAVLAAVRVFCFSLAS